MSGGMYRLSHRDLYLYSDLYSDGKKLTEMGLLLLDSRTHRTWWWNLSSALQIMMLYDAAARFDREVLTLR